MEYTDRDRRRAYDRYCHAVNKFGRKSDQARQAWSTVEEIDEGLLVQDRAENESVPAAEDR